jgi:hypothetical protein
MHDGPIPLGYGKPCGQEHAVYQFSRAIYRELAPDVIDGPCGSTNRRAMLAACEATCERLASDRDHFAKPTRTLFREIRIYFSIEKQMRVYAVIRRHLELAGEYVDQALADGRTPDGSAPHCPSLTRRGTPCRREPVPGLKHCPSHRHLEEAQQVTAA